MNNSFPSLDKTFHLKKHLERWPGPIVLTLIITGSELNEASKLIIKLVKTKRVTVIVYMQTSAPIALSDSEHDKLSYAHNIYPINLLRDLSIESIETTHYLVADADLMLSRSSGHPTRS